MQTLKELLPTFTAIADGAPWQLYSLSAWLNPSPQDCPMRCATQGFPIRLVPTDEYIPLGPEDVPPGSWIRRSNTSRLYAITCVDENAVFLVDYSIAELSFGLLYAHEWLINRSLPLTGKWDPEQWEPCRKPKPSHHATP